MALGTGVQYAGEYNLEECKILSSTGVIARLNDSVIEMNIFENMFTSSLMLNLVIIDKENMVMNMPIIGQEFVSHSILIYQLYRYPFTFIIIFNTCRFKLFLGHTSLREIFKSSSTESDAKKMYQVFFNPYIE